MKILFLFLLLTGTAFAYPAGECKSLDGLYRGTTFRVEQSSDLKWAIDFAKANKGQLVTDKDSGIYSIIYSDRIPAPETQYTCWHAMENE